MQKNECRVGLTVIFGLENGEKSLAEIVKLNPVKAKLKLLEHRGTGRGSTPGSIWVVPYSAFELANQSQKNQLPSTPQPTRKLEYDRFAVIENLILEAINILYCQLSPENLTGDGELPHYVVQEKAKNLNRQLHHLQMALGYQVDEHEVFLWSKEKDKDKS
jgi:hypothetical protein